MPCLPGGPREEPLMAAPNESSRWSPRRRLADPVRDPLRAAAAARAAQGRRAARGLGPRRRAEVFKHLHEDEIEAALARDGEGRADPPGARSRQVLEEVSRPSLALTPRRRAAASTTRARCSSASLGPERAGGDHRPPLGGDRAAAVRVPAPHAAGADRRLPAQRGAADDRARHRQPAHDARRAEVLALPAARAAGRGRAADRADDTRPARTSSARSRPSCARSCRTSSPQEYASRRRASRSPTSSTTPTARPSATCSTRSAEPDAELAEEIRMLPLHLRGHRQARRPQRPAVLQGGRRPRTSRSRCAACRTR